MRAEDARLLYEHCAWATGRILEAAAPLSDAQLQAPAAPASLRDTLLHALDTEYGWRVICQEGRETPVLPESEFPGAAALAARWREEQAEWRAYLGSLDDGQLAGPGPRGRPLWYYVAHVLMHSAQHRSEAAALLTALGRSPGDLDFLEFLSDTGVNH
jgi:uncharacterized damage-inducible protein DinB